MPQQAHRLHERFRVVDDRLVVETEELARGVARRREHLDGLEAVAPLPGRVLVPPLDVGRPGDQRVPVPEPDRVAVPLAPLRGIAEWKFAIKVNGPVHAVADEQHDLRRHEDAAPLVARGPLPHVALRPAVGLRPLVGGVDTLVIELLHHPLLVRRGQQRQHRRHLAGAHVVPHAPLHRQELAVGAVPLGHRLVGVPGRAAAPLRVGHQRLVVLLRRLERVRAHHVLACPVHLAVAPAGRGGWSGADARIIRARTGAAAAHVRHLAGGIAAPVPLVHPQVLVLVEILAGEQVPGQRLHALRRPGIPGRPRAERRHVGPRKLRRATQPTHLRRLQLRCRVGRCTGNQDRRQRCVS